MTNQAPIFIFNTLSGEVEGVHTIAPGILSCYACGPTVYSYAHIGNFRSFLTADLFVRTAMEAGYIVNYVSNITDVGHLTNDDLADASGEDKLSKAFNSQERFQNIWDMARFYTKSLLEDWCALNLIEPFVRPRATEHVAEQIELIELLLARGYAYETEMGVYFDVTRFPAYGALSGNSLDSLRSFSRDLLLDPDKRDPRDFALWKKDSHHLMKWFSPYGWGYPGWHIECSAMSMKYLGEQIDVHTGGEDNKFPHHECEIAQSESLTGRRFVRYWLHTAHLQVEGRRMSKSGQNFYTIRDLLTDGYDPLAIRYALTSARYRDRLNFSTETLEAAAKVISRLRRVRAKLAELADIDSGVGFADPPSNLESLSQQVDAAMRHDLNTPEAYAALNAGIRVLNSEMSTYGTAEASSGLAWLDRVSGRLGFDLAGRSQGRDEQNLDAFVRALISERNHARMSRDFDRADQIRDELATLGVELNDGPEGTTWALSAKP